MFRNATTHIIVFDGPEGSGESLRPLPHGDVPVSDAPDDVDLAAGDGDARVAPGLAHVLDVVPLVGFGVVHLDEGGEAAVLHPAQGVQALADPHEGDGAAGKVHPVDGLPRRLGGVPHDEGVAGALQHCPLLIVSMITWKIRKHIVRTFTRSTVVEIKVAAS